MEAGTVPEHAYTVDPPRRLHCTVIAGCVNERTMIYPLACFSC